MILYIEDHKVSTKKWLELINDFSKFPGHKINRKKSVAYLYTNNQLSERERKKTISLKITTKRIKCLGINLTKEVNDLSSENYKTLIKDFEDNTRKWKDILCSWSGRINIVKMSILHKAIYRFNATLSKYPWRFSQN